MSLTYSTYRTLMQQMLAMTDANGIALLDAVLPAMIDYAELRIQRDLDLNTDSKSQAYDLTPGNRNLTTGAGDFVVVEAANVITPAATQPDSGTRNPLTKVSWDFLNIACPSQAVVQTPQLPVYFAVLSETQVIVGPTADAAYKLELIGTQRMTPLSSGNTQTFLSTYMPDLFVAASMIFGAGYKKNFGAQADDPRMAMSWETQYQALLKSAAVEEARKKGESTGWSSQAPTPLADPPRS